MVTPSQEQIDRFQKLPKLRQEQILVTLLVRELEKRTIGDQYDHEFIDNLLALHEAEVEAGHHVREGL